jgi:hypothetical protein
VTGLMTHFGIQAQLANCLAIGTRSFTSRW